MSANIFHRATLPLVILSISTVSFTTCSHNKATTSLKENDHIVDRLEKAEHYYELHPAFKDAFEFLRQTDFAELPVGRHEIDGDRLVCIVVKDIGKSRNEAKLEAHRKYIDIQYVISGTDEMGWRPTASCKITDTSYEEAKDIGFFKDDPQAWTKVPAGSFAVFFPRDAHAPMVSDGEIHKVVLKVRVE